MKASHLTPGRSLQAAKTGFARFQPRTWRQALPEFSAVPALANGPARAGAALPGWGPARLTRVFNTALRESQAQPRGKGLPAFNEAMSVLETRKPFKCQRMQAVSLTQLQHAESHQFSLLLSRDEAATPVGLLNFNCTLSWPTAHALKPEVVEDWGAGY